MSPAPASTDISSDVAKLSLQTSNTKKAPVKSTSKQKEVADSWEDEDVSGSDTETETDGRAESSEDQQQHAQGTAAPPPTPVSPTYGQSSPATTSKPSASRTSSSPARPEKTDAVARRMIAGALGLKAPKLTDEQKAYQKAIREKERKRRDEEKAAAKQKEEEAAKARAAIWDD